MSDPKFKASLLHLTPVFASLLIGTFCAALFLYSQTPVTPITVLPETGVGPFFNAVVFVASVSVAGTLIYCLLKLGVQRLIRLLIAASITMVTFMLSVLYLDILFKLTGFMHVTSWTWMLAAVLTVAVDVEIFFRKSVFYGVVTIMLGGALGTFLGASIPRWSAVLILILLAVYYVIAVFKGPIGKIAFENSGCLRGTSFSFRQVQMGLGDLTFYSMLVARMLLSFGWPACFAAFAGVLSGSFLGFKMLERKGIFPGLPFSVTFGLAAGYMDAYEIMQCNVVTVLF